MLSINVQMMILLMLFWNIYSFIELLGEKLNHYFRSKYNWENNRGTVINLLTHERPSLVKSLEKNGNYDSDRRESRKNEWY